MPSDPKIPGHDAVYYEDYLRLKEKLARTQQVLTDLIAERSPADVAPGLLRDIARWIEHAPKLKDFLDGAFEIDDVERDNSFTCTHCGGSRPYGDGGVIMHYVNLYECPLLTLWRAIDPERYQKTMDAMFTQWCEQEQRNEEREARGPQSRLAGVRFDGRPLQGLEAWQPQGGGELFGVDRGTVNVIADPNVPQGTAYVFGESPVARMQNIQRAINMGYITEEQARRLLLTDQTLPETQGAHIARHRERQSQILGVDFGSNDGRAIAIGHIEPDGRLVVDEIEYPQPTPERDNE